MRETETAPAAWRFLQAPAAPREHPLRRRRGDPRALQGAPRSEEASPGRARGPHSPCAPRAAGAALCTQPSGAAAAGRSTAVSRDRHLERRLAARRSGCALCEGAVPKRSVKLKPSLQALGKWARCPQDSHLLQARPWKRAVFLSPPRPCCSPSHAHPLSDVRLWSPSRQALTWHAVLQLPPALSLPPRLVLLGPARPRTQLAVLHSPRFMAPQQIFRALVESMLNSDMMDAHCNTHMLYK
ncbi:uncharacterized protein LOC110399638 [Numida meleagris]|uniref:uncharacterized protein LOC110399638 n=1 Tax=Numida meleagris TaxID=8996 RepID=UPI000B3E1DFB|nr:uncharacterized protein LOC110399638 [Numida meleagris]